MTPFRRPPLLPADTLRALRCSLHLSHKDIDGHLELALIAQVQAKQKDPVAARDAEEVLVRAHRRAIRAWAYRSMKAVAGHDLTLEDLETEARMAFLKAVSKFDFKRGVKLMTYASWWVRADAGRAMVNEGYTIRVPAWCTEAVGKAMPAAARAARTLLRFDAPMPGREDRATLVDLTVSPDPRPDDLSTDKIDLDRAKQALARAMRELTPNERTVIRRRFFSKDDPTLQVVGDEMGVSRERIRQLEAVAVRKLRGALRRWRELFTDSLSLRPLSAAKSQPRARTSPTPSHRGSPAQAAAR